MKRFMFSLILALFLLCTTYAQEIVFNAYESQVIDNYTEEIYTFEDADFLIFVDDYTMELTNGTKWYFKEELVEVSDGNFYVYAHGVDGKKCKIWFKIINGTDALIGVEYVDYSFLYKTKVLKIKE